MNLARRPLLSVFALAAAMACAGLAPRLAQAAEPPFLTARQLDLTRILPTPIANGSAEARAEEQAVMAAQKTASPERIALAAADSKETVYDMFTRTLGPAFVPDNMPRAAVFFGRVGDSEDETVDPVKKVYGRTRPFLANPDIKALIPASKSGSYPSGHTTRVTLMAIVLGDMIPEKRALLWARAAEYAQSRVVGGMHYPNDLEAGRMAGVAMALAMPAEPGFRAEFEAARAEVRKALGL
jgi:acid phosphatase (class A)